MNLKWELKDLECALEEIIKFPQDESQMRIEREVQCSLPCSQSLLMNLKWELKALISLILPFLSRRWISNENWKFSSLIYCISPLLFWWISNENWKLIAIGRYLLSLSAQMNLKWELKDYFPRSKSNIVVYRWISNENWKFYCLLYCLFFIFSDESQMRIERGTISGKRFENKSDESQMRIERILKTGIRPVYGLSMNLKWELKVLCLCRFLPLL